MKQLYFFLLIFPIALTSQSQIVNIPDPNFKNALLNNYYEVIDTNGDGEIQISEAEATTNIIIYEFNITDMTGIEAFINLTGLGCDYNQLTSLDVSTLHNLTSLNCSNNQLTSLNLSTQAC